MAVFISYSHTDAHFVDTLAAHLIKAKAYVWIDRWELAVGDSLLRRIEAALEKAAALIVVLSKAAVASEWCRKELTAGLLRELEVLVLPVLLEDCEIPLFLRDKRYAAFRKSFDAGLGEVLDGWERILVTMFCSTSGSRFEGWLTRGYARFSSLRLIGGRTS